MAKDNANFDVFSKVITTLARDAAAEVDGVSLVEDGRIKKAVSVSFLQNEKVQVDIAVTVAFGSSIPAMVAELQEHVKREIEASTKFRVNAVNVSVEGVDIEQ